jgi:hypothetical protein
MNDFETTQTEDITGSQVVGSGNIINDLRGLSDDIPTAPSTLAPSPPSATPSDTPTVIQPTETKPIEPTETKPIEPTETPSSPAETSNPSQTFDAQTSIDEPTQSPSMMQEILDAPIPQDEETVSESVIPDAPAYFGTNVRRLKGATLEFSPAPTTQAMGVPMFFRVAGNFSS